MPRHRSLLTLAVAVVVGAFAVQIAARTTLSGGDTPLNISPEATKDPAFLTPLPVEHPDAAAHLPDAIDLKLPWEGTFTITQGYGYEAGGWTHQTIANTMSANDFYALDIAMPTGTPILAPADGRVLTASDRRGRDSYGIYVVIDHGHDVRSIYAHLSALNMPLREEKWWVMGGDPEVYVKQGDIIGWSGDTGTSSPHLHFVLHQGSFLSETGADIAGQAVVPEPVSGYYGIRKGHVLESDNIARDPHDGKYAPGAEATEEKEAEPAEDTAAPATSESSAY